MSTQSPLCQLKGGCMGCCGHDFVSVEKIKEAIRKNTNEFAQFNPKTEEDFLEFRDQEHKSNLRNGVCRNLIEEGDCLLCPLHPNLHKGKDLRSGHCDVDYLCKTAKIFSTWSNERKQKFIKFINGKKLTNIEYSMMMDKEILLEKFKQL